jgi:Zn-finger nucleic acid-binding protein
MSKRIHTEDEWFARHERDLIEDLKRERLRREQRLAEALEKQDAAQLKAVHWMRCPECGSEIKKEEVHYGLTVNRCTVCGGLFFDRDKLEDVLLSSEEERKISLRGVLHLMFPHWKTHQPDVHKILAEYQEDRESRQKLVAEKLAEKEAKQAQELHHMHCPNCGSKMSLYHGLVLDECPLCGGVFFDYGEFEVIQSLSDEERKSIRMQFLKMGIS